MELVGEILKRYGLKSSLITKVVGTETKGVSRKEDTLRVTVRLLIEGRIYSLEQGYKPEDLITPFIPKKDSHLVLGLDPLETLRNLKYISEKTLIILNTYKQFPKEILIGKIKERKYESYADILDLLDQFARRVITMDFYELSKTKLNNILFANIIMLGLAVEEFRDLFYKKLMIEIIHNIFVDPTKYLEAFNLGYNLVRDNFR